VANKISDEKFKEEMLRLMKSVALKVGETASEISLLRRDVDKNTRELKNLRKLVHANLDLDNDVNFRILEMFNRLFDIKKQVESFSDKFPELEEEYKRIFSESLKLAENIDENPDAKVQLDELNVGLENLEEKVFA
jgi:chromosome segregation ATPase